MAFCINYYYQIIIKSVHKKKKIHFNPASHLNELSESHESKSGGYLLP